MMGNLGMMGNPGMMSNIGREGCRIRGISAMKDECKYLCRTGSDAGQGEMQDKE